MHEGTIAKTILDTVLGAVGTDKKILSVRVHAGLMSGFEAEPLNMYFSQLSKGTIAEGAVIDLVILDTSVECTVCGFETSFDGKEHVKTDCDKCGGTNQLKDPKGVYIDSVITE